jgi:ribosomal protein L12E/L44/L45/RPP1/RPP2
MRLHRLAPLLLLTILALMLSQLDFRALAQGKSASKKAQPQQSDDKDKSKSADAKKDEEKPRDIMGGKSIGLKSSRQEKDSATMGFNGLDDKGQVTQAMLKAYATTYDVVEAKSLVAYNPVPKELDEFVQKGQLKSAPARSAPADASQDKKKDKKK